MPFQVPKLNRAEPQDTKSVGRIEFNPVDVVKPMLQQANAAERLAGDVAGFVANENFRTAEVTGMEAARSYHRYNEDLLVGENGLAYQKGNPTEPFQIYDQKVKAKREEIVNQYKNSNEMVRNAVENALRETDAKFYDRRATLFGKQKSEWEDTNLKESVAIDKEDARHAVAHLDINDPNTTVPLDAVLFNINKKITDFAISRGTARKMQEKQADGSIVERTVFDESVKMQIAKESSEALQNAIENLQQSGDVEGADYILKKYGNRLASNVKDKLFDKNKKDMQEIKGVQEFSKVRNLPYDQAFNKLDQIKDPMIRRKAQAELDDYRRQKENAKTSSSKANYDTMAKYLDERKKAGKPILSINELENDPRFKRMAPNIQQKQIDALYAQVEKPKKSDEGVKAQVYQSIQNGDMKTWDYGQFLEHTKGLSDKDKTKFENDWRDLTSQSPTQQRIMFQNMSKEMTAQMQKLGIIEKNDFGKFDNDTQITVNEWNDELRDAISTMPPELGYDKQMQYVRKFVADKKAKQVFSPPNRQPPKFMGDPNKKVAPIPEDGSTVPGVKVSKDDTMSNFDIAKKFKNQFGRWPTPEEREAFKKELGK